MSADLTSSQAACILSDLGVDVSSDDLRLERRDDRWLIKWPGERIAWIAASEFAVARLQRERQILRTLQGRVPFELPIVIAQTGDGASQLRTWIQGIVDPRAVHRRVVMDPDFALKLGRSLGRAIAAIHMQDVDEFLKALLPRVPDLPTSCDEFFDKLLRVVDDPAIHAGAQSVMTSYLDILESLSVEPRALVHGDLGFHNLVLSQDMSRIKCIIDWESACWFDPHLDFRYLLADFDHLTLFDAAVTGYEQSGGSRINRHRVVLYNAVSALGFVAHRDGVPPDVKWCGRTLAEDVAWTHRALQMLVRYTNDA